MLFNNTLLFCPPRYPYGGYIAGTITPYKKVLLLHIRRKINFFFNTNQIFQEFFSFSY